MGSLLETVEKLAPSGVVKLRLTRHMLGNSEFNATKPLRDFLADSGIFDFTKLGDGSRVVLKCLIVSGGTSQLHNVRFGFPPHKREARCWVYGLSQYVRPEEEIVWCHKGSQIIVIPQNQSIASVEKALKEIPSSERISDTQSEKASRAKIDYLKRAERNQRIGLLGEEFVLEHERSKLSTAGRLDLVQQLDHVSISKGDGFGYDIYSFDLDGEPLHIEVKTTTAGLETPAMISSNELEFCANNPDSYALYRVYELDEETGTGKLEIFNAPLDDYFELYPKQFQLVLK